MARHVIELMTTNDEDPSGMLDALRDVIEERQRQDAKWGEQNHNPIEWLSILTEEVGEAAEQANAYHWAHGRGRVEHVVKGIMHMTARDLRTELIHVAAVAVAAIESLDRNELAAPV